MRRKFRWFYRFVGKRKISLWENTMKRLRNGLLGKWNFKINSSYKKVKEWIPLKSDLQQNKQFLNNIFRRRNGKHGTKRICRWWINLCIYFLTFFWEVWIHKFYAGKSFNGNNLFALSWTFIPSFIALIEFFLWCYLDRRMWTEKYRYNKGKIKHPLGCFIEKDEFEGIIRGKQVAKRAKWIWEKLGQEKVEWRKLGKCVD